MEAKEDEVGKVFILLLMSDGLELAVTANGLDVDTNRLFGVIVIRVELVTQHKERAEESS
jgi:hypothetical protein